MCGVNLILDKKASLDDYHIQQMNTRLQHRGPDSISWKKMAIGDQKAFVGNTRLKIIDPEEHANQPMVSSDGNYLLSFNGEIYNYHDLKNQLISQGVSFCSQSDSEVLFHWLINYGKAGIKALQGMFAFIFIDKKKGQTLLARDRHGMKPLYFADVDPIFIASSEIKAIFATNLIRKELNELQIFHYLQFRYAKAPETFFKDVFALKPGHVLTIKDGKISEDCFTKKNFVETPETEEAISLKIESLLTDSLMSHLHADVPVGLLLSGGVDSTLLLALAHKNGKQHLPTFSIYTGSKEKSFGTQDRVFAKKAAVLYSADHHEFHIDQGILSHLEEHMGHMDQPIGDSASLLTDFISREAGKSIKVALTGAGADELMAGYNRHEAFYQYLNRIHFFSRNRNLLKGLSSFLPTGFDHPWRKNFRLIKRFMKNLDGDAQQVYLNFLSFDTFKSAEKLYETTSNGLFQWALDHDRENYLVSDILMLSDQMSMKNSLEFRMPYLDADFTNFIYQLPSTLLIKKGKKWFLKSILQKYRGKAFVDRPKEGFGLPTGKWLHEGHFRPFLKVLNDPESVLFRYIEQTRVQQLISQHLRKKEDYSLEIWSIVILAHWLQRHFE